jgi:hypothetical protein
VQQSGNGNLYNHAYDRFVGVTAGARGAATAAATSAGEKEERMLAVSLFPPAS